MKLSSIFIGVLNSHGFCVDETSSDDLHIGTTYVISRAILGKVSFRVCVESGDSMLDFIDNLEEKKLDYEHAYEEGALPDDVIDYGKTSLDEIIVLAEKVNRIKPIKKEEKQASKEKFLVEVGKTVLKAAWNSIDLK